MYSNQSVLTTPLKRPLGVPHESWSSLGVRIYWTQWKYSQQR